MQFTKDGVPLINAVALLGIGDSAEDFQQPHNAVGQQVDRNADVVNNPADDELDGVQLQSKLNSFLRETGLQWDGESYSVKG